MNSTTAEVNPNLVAVLTLDGVFKVHRKDCGDLKRDRKIQSHEPIPVCGRTPQEISVDLNQDFIDEGSMDLDEAWETVEFLPCAAPHLEG